MESHLYCLEARQGAKGRGKKRGRGGGEVQFGGSRSGESQKKRGKEGKKKKKKGKEKTRTDPKLIVQWKLNKSEKKGR